MSGTPRRRSFCCPRASWPCRWKQAVQRHPPQLRCRPSALVVGGMQERSQLDAIRRGARLIVATPGRLEDYIKRKLVRLDQVKILVLDEVDRMLDMGFQPAIARIAAMLPAVRQTLCYSATLEGSVKEVARKYLNNPVRIEIGSVLKPAENVELRTFEVEPDKKQELLEHLLGAETGQLPGLCAHQAWRGPRGAPPGSRRAFGDADSRRPLAVAAQPALCAASPRAVTACWWRPTWPRAASTWPTWRT